MAPPPTTNTLLDGLDLSLRRHRLPPAPSTHAAMVESLRHHGQLAPLAARECGDQLVLVDGFKRVDAAFELDWPRLSVRVLPLTEEAALVAMYSFNRSASRLIDLEEAFVVRALCRDQSLDQHQVAQLLGRHPSWVSRRLALVERLSEPVQQDLRVGLLSATAAREIARLPRGTQPDISTCARQHKLSTREVADLITAWEKTADDEERKSLLKSPREKLPSRSHARPEVDRPSGVSKEVLFLESRMLRATEILTQVFRSAEGLRVEAFSNNDRRQLGPAVRPLAAVIEGIRPLLLCWNEELGEHDESYRA